MKVFALAFALSASAALATPATNHPNATAPHQFASLKKLVGTWQPIEKAGSALRIRFYLTAGGSALVEEWRNRGKPHSLTIYHLDGVRLLATHYCPQGNQPRLRLLTRQKAGTVAFGFQDATDLVASKESYLIALTFEPQADGKLRRHETYRHGNEIEPSELLLVRVAGEDG